MKRGVRVCVALTIGSVVGVVSPGGALDAKSRITEFSAGITPASIGGDNRSDTAGALVAGPDGNVWFTEEFGNAIGRITPKGKVTEFSAGISLGAYPSGITAGPDGNLWFTERGLQGGILGGDVLPGRIGRITPKGEVTEFSAGITTRTSCAIDGSCGDEPASPEAITAGPDGNLWFTERYAGRIGRITPDGVVTEFADGISTWGGGFREPNWLGGITAGPDGNVWFTEQGGDIVGRITPDGAVTEFPTSINHKAQVDNFSAITVGPDGNLWFTAFGPGRIVRITPDGVITEFPAGGAKTPYGITVGPDGNIWFTSGNRIGRMTPEGVVSFFGAGITPGGRPAPITAGCDGNLWFAEVGAGVIGRIDPGGRSRPTLPAACPRKRS